jgi:hypothetical protein
MNQEIPNDVQYEPTYDGTTFIMQRMGMAMLKGGPFKHHPAIEKRIRHRNSWYGRLVMRCVQRLPLRLQINLRDWYDDRLNRQICRDIETPRLAKNRWRHRITRFFTPWIKRVGYTKPSSLRDPIDSVGVADNPFQVLANVVTRDDAQD